jgi:predicted alpha/beta-hydrolase family hydrolase
MGGVLETFADDLVDPPVRGFLHSPAQVNGNGLVLTHGAGSNCNAPLLVTLAEVFASGGYTVLRSDLPYRQERRTGPPFPGNSERDRAGLRNAVAAMHKLVSGRVFLGGHSYGGRQSSLLAAAEPDRVPGLLLLSYPLHPPRKPEQMRTQHLPKVQTPCLFVHGTRDPFGSIMEVENAIKLIPAKVKLMTVDGAGHDLGFKGKTRPHSLPQSILNAFELSFA